MNKTQTRLPIPWTHHSSPLVSSWIWETPHFILTIFAEGLSAKKMYNWKISDKSKGFPVPFDSALAESFTASVDASIEVIAKSYPRELGYQAYAGELATTFTVSTGQKFNFAPLIGDMVTLTAKGENGDPLIVNGIFDVQHYDIVIQTGDTTGVVIPPERVLDIRKEYGTTNVLESLMPTVRTSRNKSIIHEEWRRGCTGKPGFNPGTVEHSPNDPFCSLHNV